VPPASQGPLPGTGDKLPSQEEEMTLYIAEHTGKCIDGAQEPCLLYRSDPNGDYEPFKGQIEGFVYEPGFTYELRVLRTLLDEPAADSAIFRWTLLEVVSQTASIAAGGSITVPSLYGALSVEAVQPERYTLQFNEDGSYWVQLDCNRGSGEYMLQPDGSLELGPATSTLMGCPNDTQDSVYADFLYQAVRLKEEGDTLYIELKDNAGMMEFVRLLPDPVVNDQTTPGLEELTGKGWLWAGTTGPMVSTTIEAMDRYTLEFLPDGTLHALVDCNNMSGTYTYENGSLQIVPGPMTKMACPEGSMGNEYLKYLEFAVRAYLLGGDLFIELQAGDTTLHFTPAP